MAVNKDFEDLLHALNQEKAKFLVVGAHAVIKKNKKKLGRLQDKLDLERLKKFLKN